MRAIRSGFAVLLAAALLLAACGKDKDQAQQQAVANASATPVVAVQTTAKLLKDGDFDGFWQHVLPPADYRTLRADWGKDRAGKRPVTAKDRQQFADTMAELTAPDAETTLYAKLQPTLADYNRKYKNQLPVMMAIAQSVFATQIDNSKDLTLERKQQAKDTLAAVAQWAQRAAWGDPAKAKQAVAVVVDTARKLDLKTLDQARTLDYAQSMQRYTTAWLGAKQLLAIYGLSLDQTFDSVRTELTASKGDTATVKLSYTLLDKPTSTDIHLIRENGRWYDADLLAHWRQRHASPATPASTALAPAPANTAPAPASTAP
jgi:hypothetical protein